MSLSPRAYFGELWDHGTSSMSDHFDGVAKGWMRDVFPVHGVSREDLAHPDDGCSLSEGVQQTLDEIFENVQLRATDFQKHYEAKYKQKMGPRNGRKRKAVLAQFSSINVNWNDYPVVGISDHDVLEWFELVKIAGRKQADISRPYFNPPKEQASMGLWVPQTFPGWHTGPKGDVWYMAMSEAKYLWQVLTARCYNWRDLDALGPGLEAQIGFELCKEFGWCLVPTWRLDGGYEKLRMLLIGVITVYIIEHWFWQQVHDDLVANDACGYKPDNIKKFISGLKGPVMSGDIKTFDKTQQPKGMKAVIKAVQQHYNLPESIAVVLYLYTAYCPALVLEHFEEPQPGWYMVVRKRNGQAPSGIGGFTYVNTIYLSTCVMLNARRLRNAGFNVSESDPTNVIGDDHIRQLGMGVSKWMDGMWDNCGLLMDRRDTGLHARECVYVRRFFECGSKESMPICMSRLRNALYPEHGDPWGCSPLRTALVYRAQMYELYQSPHTSSEVLDGLIKLFPQEYFMYDEYPDNGSLSTAYATHLRAMNAMSELDAELLMAKLSANMAWL